LEIKMLLRIQESLFGNRKRAFTVLLALALLAGVVISLVSSQKANADYYAGCGYGYNSGGTGFGYGTGSGHAYGYAGTQFGYGYGNELCPMAVTTSSLAAGTAGSAYSQTLTGTGGTGTFTWSETGSLDGLSLSSGGALTGTPSSSGTFPITFTETDANHVAQSRSLSLSVAASSGGGGGGGGTTTTTAPVTTTTSITTTTTAPPAPPRFFTGKVNGFAVPGESLLLTIHGVGFHGDPTVTSNEVGTRVIVIHDRGTSLVVRDFVAFGSKTGEHTLTFRFASGQTCKANYSVQ
jgi:hypothetical protein